MNFLLNLLLAIVIPPMMLTIGNLSDAWTRRSVEFFAFLFRIFNHPGMKVIHANLTIAYPEMEEKERRKMARNIVRHLIWNCLDFIRIQKHPELSKKMLTEMDFGGIDLSKQLIVALSHLGNWELLANATANNFHRPAVIANDFSAFPKLQEMLVGSREATGLRIIYKKGAAPKCLKALEMGDTVAILMDQNLAPRKGGIFVDFYGLPVPVTPLPAILAIRSGVPVTTATTIRKEDGTFKLIVRSVPIPEGVQDNVGVTQAIMKANEEIIRQYPEQYNWFYKRWNFLPTDTEENMIANLARFPYYAKKKYTLKRIRQNCHDPNKE